jgi:hypothetical protein
VDSLYDHPSDWLVPVVSLRFRDWLTQSAFDWLTELDTPFVVDRGGSDFAIGLPRGSPFRPGFRSKIAARG